MFHSRFVPSDFHFLYVDRHASRSVETPAIIDVGLHTPRYEGAVGTPSHETSRVVLYQLATLRRARRCSNRGIVPRPADLVLRSRVDLDRWSWSSALADRTGERRVFTLSPVWLAIASTLPPLAWITSRPLGATSCSNTIRAAGGRGRLRVRGIGAALRDSGCPYAPLYLQRVEGNKAREHYRIIGSDDPSSPPRDAHPGVTWRSE